MYGLFFLFFFITFSSSASPIFLSVFYIKMELQTARKEGSKFFFPRDPYAAEIYGFAMGTCFLFFIFYFVGHVFVLLE